MSRPRSGETRERTREFLRLLNQGESLAGAARQAQLDPGRVLHLLDDQAFYAVATAILDGRLGPTAVVAVGPAAPAPEQLAA